MLCLLRFVFSMLVVLAHLAEGTLCLSHWGVFSVFGFYVISGYLMALVLNDTYSFRFSAFAVNRGLRLFPSYLAIAVLTIVALQLQPDAGSFHSGWKPVPGIRDVLANALIIPFEFVDSPFRLIPPAWSVAAELINYFLLWLVVARSRRLAFASALLSIAFHAWSVLHGAHWEARYFPYYAALLPFSLGACLYFQRNALASLSRRLIRGLICAASLVWCANLVLCGLDSSFWGNSFDRYFYINLAALLVIVGGITALPARVRSDRRARVEKWLGDLAYPVFLCHWLVGFEVSRLLGGPSRGLLLFALSVIPIIALSIALIWLEAKWITPLRDRIRCAVRPEAALQPA